MAYFECVIGSATSGGNGADLIVTCGSVFAGSTITCTDGNTTFTETCPSSSPYTVTFASIPTGTWTISGVVSGQTFTETVTVTDFTATLNAIPDGSTVTPTDDIQTWLHCASIFDKAYTTISQVLSDGTTVTALIASNNAVDYMARSTTWASSVVADSSAMTKIGANDYCATKLLANSTWLNAICNSTYFENVLNVKIPTMTSDTAPSGNCSASSTYSATYAAFKAFDGVISNEDFWATSALNDSWVKYAFSNDGIIPYLFKVYGAYGAADYSSRYPFTYKIQGSNDNSNFVDLTDSLTCNYSDVPQNTKIKYHVGTKYKYLRAYISSGTSFICIAQLQAYGRA